MRVPLVLLIVCVALSLLVGTGCIAVSNPKTINRATTLGQELIDLQKAKECEAITDQEYQQLRKKLMDAAGRPCTHKDD